MSGGSKTETSNQSQAQTSTNTLDPDYKAAVMGNLSGAQTRAASLLPYSGQLTAGFTPTQLSAQSMLTGIANDGSYKAANGRAIGSITGVATNPLSGAITPTAVSASPIGATPISVTPVTAGTVQGNAIAAKSVSPSLLANTDLTPYENPFTHDVINTTIADQERARQIQGANDARQAAAQGAFGGSRSGVAAALTNEAYDRNTASLLAGLNSDNFTQARSAASTDIANKLAADQFNATNSLTADQFNANQRLNADQYNVTNKLNADQYNAGQSLTEGQFNAGQDMNARQFNAGQDMNAQQFNAGQSLTAQQNSFANALAARDQTLTASNDLLNANNAALDTAQHQAALESSVGDAQQAQQQAGLDAAYQAYLNGEQLTLEQQQMLDQALGLVPAQQTITSSGTSNGTTNTKTNGGLTGMLGGLGSLAGGLGAMGVTL